jgi:hypothetical protein
MNVLDKINQYESGEMNERQKMDFFAYLKRSRLYLDLQGSYTNTLMRYIDCGYIDHDGEITEKGFEYLEDCE